MPKISRYKLEKQIEELILKQLAQVFQKITKEDDISLVINNLFTKTERAMLAKRLAIAILLNKGWNYTAISNALKVSPTTISFIKNSKLNTNPEYEDLLNKLERTYLAGIKEKDFINYSSK